MKYSYIIRVFPIFTLNVLFVELSFQAFCSSITGTLATQAMLKGYGVGDEKASALAATMTWILRSELFSKSFIFHYTGTPQEQAGCML